MDLLHDETQAAMQHLSEELREVAQWLDTEAPNVPSVPAGRWVARLQDHIREWDEILREREILPKSADADREQARRIMERAAAFLSSRETEEQHLLRVLSERLDELCEDVRSLAEHLGEVREQRALAALSSDLGDWRRRTRAG